MYVSASINGQAVCALLDTGATHNFISEDEAKRLGLKAIRGACTELQARECDEDVASIGGEDCHEPLKFATNRG